MDRSFSIKRTFRMIIVDLMIFVMVFSVAETILRNFVPGMQRLVYTKTISGGHPISYNSYGLRDVEFLQKKPSGEKRILVLGNSTTFGSGVAMESAYPKQLEKILGAPYRVINAGGQGSSLQETLGFLETQGFDFKPDLIVLGFSSPMIGKTTLENKRNHGFAERWRNALLRIHQTLAGSYVYLGFNHYVRKNLYKIGAMRDDLSTAKSAVYAYGFDAPNVNLENVEADYLKFGMALEQLRDVSRARDVPLMILALPCSFDLGTGPAFNPRYFPLDKIRIEPLDRISNIANSLGIPFVDIRGSLQGRSDVYIPGDFSHMNERGHHETARILAKAMDAQ